MSAADDAWRPTAPRAALLARAALLSRLRTFFSERGVLEVETPLLSSAGTTDPQIHSFTTRYHGPGGERRLYLATSPEFPMKRLLAAGSGPIYQVCKAFRQGEAGCLHNPEFTLLEWYRPGFDHHRLMDEVEELLAAVCETPPSAAERLAYGEVFEQHLDIDPHRATVDELRRIARTRPALADIDDLDRDGWLDLLMSHCIQPALGREAPCFIYHYPASQAALARIAPGEPPLAERFELIWHGIELANGFHELTDAAQQRQRFIADNNRRRAMGLAEVPIDEQLLAALGAGLPDCAGVALGLDRLLLMKSPEKCLSSSVAFPILRA